MDDPLEVLCTKDDYFKMGRFVRALRDRTDPAPKVIDAPIAVENCQRLRCPANALTYARAVGGQPVKGFKLWKIDCDLFGGVQYKAVVHVVVYNPTRGTYVDPTPPEQGDENKRQIFVPSSRVYPSFTAEQLGELSIHDLLPRMGCVMSPRLLMVTLDAHLALPGQASRCADALTLFVCPTKRHVFKRGVRLADIAGIGGEWYKYGSSNDPLDERCVVKAVELGELFARNGFAMVGDAVEPSSEC